MQYLVLRQLNSGLMARDQGGEWEGELPNAPNSPGSFTLWAALPCGPPIWRLAPDVQSSRLLDLAAHWHEISGCELKLWIESFKLGTRTLARNKINHLVWVNCILVTLFGTPFIHHQQGSLSDVGMPPTWEKGSHLPPWTTRLGNIRGGHDLSQLLLLNQISRILLLCVEPTQGYQKCDSATQGCWVNWWALTPK